MKSFKVSVIIPTFNRVKDLNRCLNSLKIQTVQPMEIIIVDDSTNDIIKKLSEGGEIKYIKNKGDDRGITICRNIGIKNSKGDIILMLDDDVILEKKYIEELLKVYNDKNVLGVQGYITNIKKPFTNLFRKIFYLSYIDHTCRILPSVFTTYVINPSRVMSCEWMSGSNHSFRKEVYNNIKYDENLKKYSYGEDVDMTYRIYKKYPGSLKLTPFARCIHNVSKEYRTPNKELLKMEKQNKLYIFKKNINQTLKNKIIFKWSRIGNFLMRVFSKIIKKKR